MGTFKWSTACQVYIPEMDTEHRELYRVANQLQRLVATGKDAAGAEALLMSLIEHVEKHFAHEEELMEASEYPARDWHVRQHQTARKKTLALVRKIRKGESQAAFELLDFLAGWMKDHISVADKIMAAHLRNRRRLALAS